MTNAWRCSCSHTNGFKKAWCGSCGVHFSQVKWSLVQGRSRSQSKGKKGDAGKKADPLKPFTAESPEHATHATPWRTSTPMSRAQVTAKAKQGHAGKEEQQLPLKEASKEGSKFCRESCYRGTGCSRPCGTIRSYQEGAWREPNTRNAPSLGADGKATGKRKTTTHTLPYQQSRKSKEGSHKSSTANRSSRHRLEQIQSVGGEQSEDPERLLFDPEKGTSGSTCSKDGALEAAPAGDPEGGGLGHPHYRSREPGRRGWELRVGSGSRCGADRRLRRDFRTQATEEAQGGRGWSFVNAPDEGWTSCPETSQPIAKNCVPELSTLVAPFLKAAEDVDQTSTLNLTHDADLDLRAEASSAPVRDLLASLGFENGRYLVSALIILYLATWLWEKGAFLSRFWNEKSRGNESTNDQIGYAQRTLPVRKRRWGFFGKSCFIACHLCSALAMEAVSPTISREESPVLQPGIFEPGEIEHVQFLTGDAFDESGVIFTVWVHAFDFRHVQCDRRYEVTILHGEDWEIKLLDQLHFLRHFGPRFWHRILPNPYFSAEFRPHLVVWQEMAWRQNFGVFLVKFVDRAFGDGMASWGTILVQKQVDLIPMERIFKILHSEHKCDSDFRCTVRSKRLYSWPEAGFFASGTLLTVVHEPQDSEEDSTFCDQKQKRSEQKTTFQSNSLQETKHDKFEGDLHSLIAFEAPFGKASEFQSLKQCKHDSKPAAAWRYGQELGRREASEHRQIMSVTTQFTGGRQIQAEITGLISRSEDLKILVHMHGLAESHIETKSRVFEMRRYDQWEDFYADVRNAWIGQIHFFQDIRVIYVTPQPYSRLGQNMDGVHLIIDTMPERNGSPQLFVVNFRFGSHSQEEPIYETFRCFRERKTCSMMLEDLGFSHMCQQREATCNCRLGITPYHDPSYFVGYDGASIDFDIQMTAAETLGGDDEQSLMALTRRQEARIRNYFLYREKDDEPAVVQRFDPDQVEIPGANEEERIIYQYKHCEAYGGEDQITIHFLTDQPEDVIAFRARGFVLVDENARPTGKSLVLVDIGFYLAGSPMTLRGHKPHDEWREALSLPGICTRSAVIENLGLRSFCQDEEDECTIWHRGNPWYDSETAPKAMRDGDYIIVRVLQRNTALPLQIQWQFAQEACDQELMDAAAQQERNDDPSMPATSNATLPLIHGERQDESEDEAEDVSSYLAIRSNSYRSRPSSTSFAMARLPPPGNGKVQFSSSVEFWDGQEHYFRRDWSCENALFEEMCTLRGEGNERDNPFFHEFAHELRFCEMNTEETKNEVPKEDEMNQTSGILPIRLEDCLSNEYLPLEADNLIECGVDLKPVLALREVISQHMTIPVQDMSVIRWKKEAMPWVDLPPWTFNAAASLHFYTDGSCEKGMCSASAVLFVFDGVQWFHGGFCQHRLEDGGTNLTADLYGSMIATKWAWDILRCFEFWGFDMPEVHLYYDCMASGLMGEGRWQGAWDNALYKSTRTMAQMLEKISNTTVQSHHQKGHMGDPGNEAADDVAKDGLKKPRKSNLWDLLCRDDVSDLLQWVWLFDDPEMKDMIHDGVLRIPKAQAIWEPRIAGSIEGTPVWPESGTIGKLDFKMATYNVMTLKPKAKKGQDGPGHLRSLLRQCRQEGIHFLALQETRIQREHIMKDPDYAYINSPADKAGNGGTLLAWCKSLHFAWDHKGEKVFLKEQDVNLLFKNEQVIVAKIENPFLRAIIVVLHSPHSGHPEETIVNFWKDLHKPLQKWKNWPMVLLGDTNSRMGQNCNDLVGNYGAETSTKSSECFFEFLCDFRLWLPATFESTHRGGHFTWYHPSGTGSRLDYCAIPTSWAEVDVTNEVLDSIGVHNTLFDHQPVCVHVRGCIETHQDPGAWKLRKPGRIQIDLDKPQNVTTLRQLFEQTPRFRWDMDIHRHVDCLHRSILRRAKRVAHRPTHTWKEHLSEDTWAAIGEKTKLRKKFFAQTATQRLAKLRILWNAWKKPNHVGANLANDLKKADFELALITSCFRRMSIKAQKLVRADDNAFLHSFTLKCEDAANRGDYRRMWKDLKRFLPKHQSKKKSGNVRQNEALREQWAPHLCQMEAGRIASADEIYRECIRRQNANPGVKPSIAEIPSLLAVEWSLRESKAGRQGGMDGLEPAWIRCAAKELAPLLWRVALKQNLWGVEALQFKGGALTMIQKPGGSKSDAGGFRGILLSAELGKRLQALTRRELISSIFPSRPPLQLGGYQSMEPAFGAQFVRSYVKTCSASNCSCSVIFVDLKAAYHSLIRQLLTGRCSGDQNDIEKIYGCLQEEGIEIEEIAKAWQDPSILDELEVSDSLKHRMQEYNMDTWSNIFGAGCLVKTCRGSRPGSPLADAQFSGLMSKIGHQLQAYLTSHPSIKSTSDSLDLEPATVIWADDLAIVFPIADNSMVLETTGDVMTEAEKCFTTKGLTVNYRKGKSEAAVTICGKGSRVIRKTSQGQ